MSKYMTIWDSLQGKPVGRLIANQILKMLFDSMHKSLRGVYIKGDIPKKPLVLAFNHHSFFDGHLIALLVKLYNMPATLLISKENMERYPMFKLAGALEVNNLREAIRRLNQGEWVAIFPEGELRYMGDLGPIRPGAEYIARKAGVEILPIALRVVVRGFEHPEAFVLVGEPISHDAGLARALGELLRELDRILSNTHPREIPEGFRCVLKGQRSLEERIEVFLRYFRKI